MKKIVICVLALLSIAFNTAAQGNGNADWDVQVVPKGGNEFEIVVSTELPPQAHLTDFSITISGEGVTTSGPVHEKKLHSYSRPVTVQKPTEATVMVEWQICEGEACFSPQDTEFQITLEPIECAADPITPDGTEMTATANSNLWKIILEAILWGFVALLTPCVFPMVPMTVSFFLKQNEGASSNKGKFLASAFGTFIIALYTIPIAVIILITYFASGQTVTADIFNWIATHWLPNILFFLIFMAFALSFFGLYEITLPNWMINKSDSKSNAGSIGGVFFVALTLVLVSFSCTGPIVGSVLIKSTQGQFWEPILTMLAFSTAFALPFTLLAFAPSLMHKFPKSGGWLNSVKITLGFIEIALGLKFLSVADQTYHWGILPRWLYLSIWIADFTLLTLYLAGILKFKSDGKPRKKTAFRWSFAAITAIFVIYLTTGLFGAPLKAISGYLPPMVQEGLPYHLKYFEDYEEARADAIRNHKPLFVDFTGHGCVNCREMEARVWSDPRVKKLLKEEFIICALYADDKLEAPERKWITTPEGKTLKTVGKINSYFALTHFGVNAQPYYAILDPESEEHLTTPRSYNLDIEEYILFLQSALEKYNGR